MPGALTTDPDRRRAGTQQKLDQALELLCEARTPREIEVRLAEEHGMSRRNARRYIAGAWRMLRLLADQAKPQHRELLIGKAQRFQKLALESGEYRVLPRLLEVEGKLAGCLEDGKAGVSVNVNLGADGLADSVRAVFGVSPPVRATATVRTPDSPALPEGAPEGLTDSASTTCGRSVLGEPHPSSAATGCGETRASEVDE